MPWFSPIGMETTSRQTGPKRNDRRCLRSTIPSFRGLRNFNYLQTMHFPEEFAASFTVATFKVTVDVSRSTRGCMGFPLLLTIKSESSN
jgi:hypothetical protein